MKDYQKNILVGLSAANQAPLYFTFNVIDPQPNVRITRVYSNTGAYLGWTTPEIAYNYIYAKLYYKTKGRYEVSSSRGSRRTKYSPLAKNTLPNGIKYIRTKVNSAVALVLNTKSILPEDLIDTSIMSNQAQLTLDKLKVGANVFNSGNDPYKLYAPQLEAFNREYNALSAKYKDLIYKHLEEAIKIQASVNSVLQLRTLARKENTAA